MADIEARLTKLEQRQKAHGEVLAALEGVSTTMHQISEQVADLVLQVGPQQADKVDVWTNVAWHELRAGSDELKAELYRLRGWLKQIAIPVLGWSFLPECVLMHPPACVAIDVCTELYRVSWFPEARNQKMLDRQATYLVHQQLGLQHIVQAAVSGCDHQSGLKQIPPELSLKGESGNG